MRVEVVILHTSAFKKHNAMNYVLYVKISDDVPDKLLEEFQIGCTPILQRGCALRQDIGKYFVEVVVEIARRVDQLFNMNITIIMSEEEDKLKTENIVQHRLQRIIENFQTITTFLTDSGNLYVIIRISS